MNRSEHLDRGSTSPSGRIDPLAWIADEADAWSRKGLERRLIALGASTPGWVYNAGRPVLNFASNDYLGLANDPRVIAAATAAAERYGWGSGASPLVAGWREPHEALAAALARFEGVEAVALFTSGFAANLGAITALVGPGDVVYSDRLNHASLIDGVRLAGAKLRIYPHNDVNRLAAILDRDQHRFRRSMITTDSVFSMDGDVAPLADLVELAERTGAILLVDEAHGTGVHGSTGRGAIEAAGLEPGRVHVKVGTLSKALGSVGGFVAGSRRLVAWLQNQARTLIYSTAPPVAAAAAAHRALELLVEEPERRQQLTENTEKFRTFQRNFTADACSFNGSGPIIPWIVGESRLACELARQLLETDCLVPAIRPPSVPVASSRLRVSLTAGHKSTEVDHLIASFQNILSKTANFESAGIIDQIAVQIKLNDTNK